MIARAETDPVQRLLLHSVPWSTYGAMLRELDGRHLRITFAEGSLEIMTLSYEHEKYGRLFDKLMTLLSLGLRVPIASGGSLTLRTALQEKGLEPDQCYWIKHERLMRDKAAFDSKVDPAPELAIEVDVSHSSLDRLAIYAALGVPEVWRFDGVELLVYRLDRKGSYKVSPRSRAFPYLPMKEMLRFVLERDEKGEMQLLDEFVEWVRTTVAPLAAARKPGRRKP